MVGGGKYQKPGFLKGSAGFRPSTVFSEEESNRFEDHTLFGLTHLQPQIGLVMGKETPKGAPQRIPFVSVCFVLGY